MGNKADVSGNDLVEYWENDPSTRVICMYLESFGNPRRFTEHRQAGQPQETHPDRQVGPHRRGRPGSLLSHTGAIAGADLPCVGISGATAVSCAPTPSTELFDVATRRWIAAPLPAGNRRIAILTNAGGPAIMATDACVNLDLEIADAQPDDHNASVSWPISCHAEASVHNPIDMIASATAEKAMLRALGIAVGRRRTWTWSSSSTSNAAASTNPIDGHGTRSPQPGRFQARRSPWWP